MKKIFDRKKILKEAGILLITTVMLLSTVVTANTEQLHNQPLMLEEGWTMMIENTTADPGDVGHVIQVNGTWSDDILKYYVRIYYDPEVIEITDVNADGCIGETGSPYVYHFDECFIFHVTFDDPYSAGAGKLANIVVDIIGGPCITEVTFCVVAEYNYYKDSNNVQHNAEVCNGILVIGEDTTPPETTCILEGEMNGDIYISNVNVTLEATDDMSGVDYTMYKLDDGDWGEYEDTFVVSDKGEHTVYYYSVDNEGNEEDEKSTSFTIGDPCYIELEISGGFGVTVVVKNTGEEDFTDVEWSIILDGGFIILGKETSGKVDIPAGESVEIKSSLILGIGLGILTEIPTITVNAGCAEKTTSAKVFLFLVLGL